MRQVSGAKSKGGLGTAIATLVAPVAWGTTYLTVTEILPPDRPILVAAGRVAPAGIVLLLIGWVASRWRPRGVEWWRTIALSLCYFGVFFPLLIVSVYRLPGGVAAAVGGTQPILVATFTFLLTGLRPKRIDLAVGVAASIGVALVVLQPDAAFETVGVLAAIGANVSFAVGVVLTKKFPTPPNRIADTGWQMILAGLVLVPLALLVEGSLPPLDGVEIAGFAYLSLIVTAVAFLLWLNGVRRLPPAAPPLLNQAVPVTAALLGWVVLDQVLAAHQLLGLAMVIGAIAYGATIPGRATRGMEDTPTPT